MTCNMAEILCAPHLKGVVVFVAALLEDDDGVVAPPPGVGWKEAGVA
jgi:hypothetical protein